MCGRKVLQNRTSCSPLLHLYLSKASKFAKLAMFVDSLVWRARKLLACILLTSCFNISLPISTIQPFTMSSEKEITLSYLAAIFLITITPFIFLAAGLIVWGFSVFAISFATVKDVSTAWYFYSQ